MAVAVPLGRWVFVPLPKWETLPPEYYSIRKSHILLTLFRRQVPAPLIDFCLEADLLPPPKIRRRKLIAWIEARQRKITPAAA